MEKLHRDGGAAFYVCSLGWAGCALSANPQFRPT